MQKIQHVFFNILFLIGWGLFYLSEIAIFSNQIIPGDLYSSGKPPDINIYIYTVMNLGFVIGYSFLFIKYFKKFFIQKISLKQKIALIGISLLYGFFWLFMVGFVSRYISYALNIAHIDKALWYYL